MYVNKSTNSHKHWQPDVFFASKRQREKRLAVYTESTGDGYFIRWVMNISALYKYRYIIVIRFYDKIHRASQYWKLWPISQSNKLLPLALKTK